MSELSYFIPLQLGLPMEFVAGDDRVGDLADLLKAPCVSPSILRSDAKAFAVFRDAVTSANEVLADHPLNVEAIDFDEHADAFCELISTQFESWVLSRELFGDSLDAPGTMLGMFL